MTWARETIPSLGHLQSMARLLKPRATLGLASPVARSSSWWKRQKPKNPREQGVCMLPADCCLPTVAFYLLLLALCRDQACRGEGTGGQTEGRQRSVTRVGGNMIGHHKHVHK